jgi:hypothetical protein
MACYDAEIVGVEMPVAMHWQCGPQTEPGQLVLSLKSVVLRNSYITGCS